MSLLSKRIYRAIKTILVSPQAEVISLFIRILCIFTILYLDTLNDVGDNQQIETVSQDKQIQGFNIFNNYLMSSQEYQNKQSNATLHIIKDYFWELFVDPTEYESLISGIRILQYSVQFSQDCYYDFNQLNNNSIQQELYLNFLLGQCNSYNFENLETQQPSFIAPNSTDLCLYDTNCTEFKLQDIYVNTYENLLKKYTVNQISTQQFGLYPKQAFIADIQFNNQTEFVSHLTKLINNNWVTNNTLAVVLQFNKINKQDNLIYQNIFIQQIYESYETGLEFKINQVDAGPYSSTTWYPFTTILLIFNIFFIMKIIFEGSIDPRPTQILVFLVSLVEIVFVIMCLVEASVLDSDLNTAQADSICTNNKLYIHYNNGFPLFAPCHAYILLDATIQIQQIRLIFFILVILFLPFNIFWVFSYIEGTQLIVKFINLIYRTTLHFVKLIIVRLAQYFIWSLAFYIAFKKNFSIYSSYQNSLYCMIIWSIPTQENEWERGALNTGQMSNAMLICIFFFCRVYIILMLLSFTSIAIHCASDFEFDTRNQISIQNLENVNINIKKLDKFSKIYLTDNEQNKLENGKLVVWLCFNVLTQEQIYQIDQECYNKQVKLQQFTNLSDLAQFVNFLFQIKPQLLFKSQIYFRIMLDLEIENEQFQNSLLFYRNDEKQKEYVNLARFLQQLKDKGSRVPVLLNYDNKSKPSDNVIITFFKLYPYIYWNNGNFELFKEFILSQDVRTWQKRMYFCDDDNNQEFEEDESEVNQLN